MTCSSHLQSLLYPHYFYKPPLAKVSNGFFLAKSPVDSTQHQMTLTSLKYLPCLTFLGFLLPLLLILLLLLWLFLVILLCRLLFFLAYRRPSNVRLPTVHSFLFPLILQEMASIDLFKVTASGAELWSKTFS